MKAKAQPKQPRKPSVVTIEEKHDVFATAYMETGSASEAARVAGYHPGSAGSTLRSEEVQLALKEGRKELENVSSIKRMDVLNIFMEAIDMARTMADPANMINGADKIAKMLGYYEPEKVKVEITSSQEVLRSKIRQLSDEDLYDLAYSRARHVDGEVVQ